MNIEAYATQIIDFVRDHQAWAAPIVFTLAFAESLAFISLLVPAWAALVGIGALIMSSGLSFWPVLVAGALGAAQPHARADAQICAPLRDAARGVGIDDQRRRAGRGGDVRPGLLKRLFSAAARQLHHQWMRAGSLGPHNVPMLRQGGDAIFQAFALGHALEANGGSDGCPS